MQSHVESRIGLSCSPHFFSHSLLPIALSLKIPLRNASIHCRQQKARKEAKSITFYHKLAPNKKKPPTFVVKKTNKTTFASLCHRRLPLSTCHPACPAKPNHINQ